MTTKPELIRINSELSAQLAAAQKRIGDLEADIVRITECASAVNRMPRQRPQYEMPQWQKDRRAAMDAARDLARTTGRAIKV